MPFEDAQARAQQARAVDPILAERFRAEATALRRQRHEAQQLVDGLVAGVPRGAQRRRHLGTGAGGHAPSGTDRNSAAARRWPPTAAQRLSE
ncbi:hypothetical protein P3H15_54730, partial [Rhodococcus sp. T2V]|uniref:hypothetical protein n=1 Tax=Rhodococcus sp. T2V TaxID=3034164 RepID=UPI0023E27C8E